MAQYLVAQWDYVAEGNYELSFKEGDKIKLLEKHNDDWWEGELNDEIGFFPANRTAPAAETTINKSSSSSTSTTPNIDPPRPTNPYLPSFDLPEGWSHSYDQSGKVYFFNEKTGESQWEKPQDDLVYDINKLNLEALHPNWIRLQNHVQIKIIKDETISSWKDYYAVLTNRFILVYKEGLNKMGRRPSSFKHVPAYYTVDLKSASLVPATKSDTRKKYAVIIDIPDNYKILLSLPNETLYTEWLDAIMREMINANDNKEQQDIDLVELLASLDIQSKLSAQQTTESNPDDTDAKSTLTRWFSRSSRNNSIHKTPVVGHDIIGGQLKLEQDGNIPLIVQLCIDQVEKRGLDVVGIYRLSGQSTCVQKWKTQFNSKPEEVNLDQEPDINVITGLLKLYFRELKNPLLTFEYYDRFIEAARLQDYDERMFRIKSIIQVLPVPNYKVLSHLARHLERVKENSHMNKMETTNLALIFSMSLLRSKGDDIPASILHNDLSSKVIEIIVNNVDWFFDIDTDDESSI